MTYARIVDDVAVEVITWSPEGRYPADWTWVECPPETVQRSTFDGQDWTHPEPVPEPEPADPPSIVPQSVDRRQILTGLGLVGWITEQEAEAALTIGARPAAVDTVINSLPDEQRYLARMKWGGFRNAYRNDPMVAALAAIEGKTEQDIDEFFILCSTIE